MFLFRAKALVPETPFRAQAWDEQATYLSLVMGKRNEIIMGLNIWCKMTVDEYTTRRTA